MLDLTQCSASQSEAITHGTGPMLVLAGPGSGKTFVITRRIQYLIEYHHVPPEQILVITFTKAAATQMQERFLKLTSESFMPVTFGTFHAFFYQILKQTYHFNASSILKESDKRKMMKNILHHIPEDLKNEPCMLLNSIDKNGEVNQDMMQRLISEISKVKNLGLAASEYESTVCTSALFAFIYEQYSHIAAHNNKLDFDDMVILCLELLKAKPSVLRLWQKRYSYILIDEFQDISPSQYEVIRLLADAHRNLFIVGDDDQSIYGFRGSRPQLMLDFARYYPECRQVILDINYRSKSDIVKHAANLISHNQNRFIKNVCANEKEPGIFKIHPCTSREEEMQNIILLIQQYMKREQAHYSDLALIYRTNTNACMAADRLLHENIPFHMQEKPVNIYQSPTARDIMAYIRYALYEEDVASFYRIMNRPSRYIQRERVPVQSFSMQELIKNNHDKEYVIHNILHLYNQLHFLKKLDPYAAINYIRHGIGYEDYCLKQSLSIQELEELQERAAAFDTLKEWLYHAEHYDELIQESSTGKEEDAVQLVTMHASKGLEWNTVILPDINEGITPHKKAISQEEIEEERRMFYVAITRAKENLFLFYIKEKTGGNFLPSRFLTDLQKHAASD